ncbi:MAG: hypothetical protein N3G22_03595 [Candidatus Micrarchaeota archaeon]|nr:hypothetical protein [Candidatus Micrarchaeota archaeon]
MAEKIPDFKMALLMAGIALILIGAGACFFNRPPSYEQSDIVDLISFGFTSFFFSIFAGVLIGVGIALIANSFILRAKGNLTHVVLSFISFVVSVLVAIAAVYPSSWFAFHFAVLFFAGMSAAGAFLISTIAFVLSDAMKHHFLRKK